VQGSENSSIEGGRRGSLRGLREKAGVRPCAQCLRIHKDWKETCGFYRDEPPRNIINEFLPDCPPSDPSESSSEDESDDGPD
jgi:hypothetical protein